MPHYYKFIALFVLCLACKPLYAQDIERRDTTYWKKEFQTGGNFNQATFSNNWKAGGVNTLAVGALFHGVASYERKHHKWRNEVQLDYGFQKLRGVSSRKTLDRIFVDSKYTRSITPHLNLFGNGTLITQFAQGFTYSKDGNGVDRPLYVSHFFAPAYLVEAFGLQYVPVSYWNIDMGVGGLRHTFVTDTSLYHNVTNNYGVPVGRVMRTQAVFQLATNFNKDVLQNLNIKVRYAALLDYEKLHMRNIVHRVDLNVTAKVNKYITASLTSILLYDIDQDADIQYNQMMGLGFVYKY